PARNRLDLEQRPDHEQEGDAEASKEQSPTKTAHGNSSAPNYLRRIQGRLKENPAQIYLDQDGALTTAHQIKNHDGPRSLEKEHAHTRRDGALVTQLEKIEKDYAEEKMKGTKTLYHRIKSVYRAPPDALQHVLEVLAKEGWTVCRCSHQADSCITRCVKNAADPDDVRVLTKDSDLIVYEATTSITLLDGQDWKTFPKQELLELHSFSTHT
ncbi:hypothetical protein BGZ68_002213, partial [Mortierella alpina]